MPGSGPTTSSGPARKTDAEFLIHQGPLRDPAAMEYSAPGGVAPEGVHTLSHLR